VIIFPDHVQERWWRQEGHRLAREDLEPVLAEKPKVLVVGTGYYGRMQVPEQTLDALRSAGIDVRVEKTGSAVGEFNRLQRGNRQVRLASAKRESRHRGVAPAVERRGMYDLSRLNPAGATEFSATAETTSSVRLRSWGSYR
jgi:hypothetical protein